MVRVLELGWTGLGLAVVGTGMVKDVFMFMTRRLLASSYVDFSIVLATEDADERAADRLPGCLLLMRDKIICVAAENSENCGT
jgi:hypothetical protein